MPLDTLSFMKHRFLFRNYLRPPQLLCLNQISFLQSRFFSHHSVQFCLKSPLVQISHFCWLLHRLFLKNSTLQMIATFAALKNTHQMIIWSKNQITKPNPWYALNIISSHDSDILNRECIHRLSKILDSVTWCVISLILRSNIELGTLFLLIQVTIWWDVDGRFESNTIQMVP